MGRACRFFESFHLRVCRVSVIAAIVAAFLFNTPPSRAGTTSSNPCCGLYSLYTVIRMNGGKINFADLVTPEYVGNSGSSMEQLIEAAKHFSEYPTAYKDLSIEDLRQFDAPLILHVKAESNSISYNHFYVLLGIDGHSAKIFNPPEGAHLIPMEQLARDWDGSAILVSVHQKAESRYLIPMYGHLIFKIAGVLIVILVMRWLANSRTLQPRFSLSKQLFVEVVVLMSMALGMALSYNFIASNGLLNRASSWEPLKQAYVASFAEKLDIPGVQRAIARGAVVVDARLTPDFDAGHIPNAISVPVTAKESQRHLVMANIPLNQEIVLYCQSEGCPFSGQVAKDLASDGYDNIKIFRDGWVGWEKVQGANR